MMETIYVESGILRDKKTMCCLTKTEGAVVLSLCCEGCQHYIGDGIISRDIDLCRFDLHNQDQIWKFLLERLVVPHEHFMNGYDWIYLNQYIRVYSKHTIVDQCYPCQHVIEIYGTQFIISSYRLYIFCQTYKIKLPKQLDCCHFFSDIVTKMIYHPVGDEKYIPISHELQISINQLRESHNLPGSHFVKFHDKYVIKLFDYQLRYWFPTHDNIKCVNLIPETSTDNSHLPFTVKYHRHLW
jgi:hypothetical protein